MLHQGLFYTGRERIVPGSLAAVGRVANLLSTTAGHAAVLVAGWGSRW